jgi:hypothetical protein
MRARRGIGGGAAAIAAGAALVACFDLFHSTSDIETACALDASRDGCAPPSIPQAVDTDFCAWSPAEAQEHAVHACSWLGACETPMGNNAFGPCSFRALMAYDCAANPNHRARADAHRLWDCLQRVRSCGEVDACVFGGGPPLCGEAGAYTVCTTSPQPAAVRVQCGGDGAGVLSRAFGENCALWGQTCAEGPGGTACAGEASGLSCTNTDRGCSSSSLLHWCEASADGGAARDLGIDCASNGAGACGGFPVPSPAYWTACKAETDAAPGTADCAPDASATCDNGRAVSCPSGVVETLDCATLLHAPSACNEGPLDPPFDWTAPCAVEPAQCASDSCDGSTVMSCERGANFQVDCATETLGPCRLVSPEPGAMPRAACTPPSR